MARRADFSLMTIKVGPANPYTYLLAKMNKYDEIVPEENMKADGESDQDYMKRRTSADEKALKKMP